MEIEKYGGIFAAGAGSRLKKYAPDTLKPLVKVAGIPLIDWTIKSMIAMNYTHITVLLNSKGKPVKEHLKNAFPNINFVFILKDTASSYESFNLVSQTLAQNARTFLLSTVDSLYHPDTLKEFVKLSEGDDFAAALGITDKVHDEKPLWADINKNGEIIAMGQNAKDKKYATSGIYLLTQSLVNEMPHPSAYEALREYLQDIAAQGKKIKSVMAPDSVDVDTEEDIKIAERFIRTTLAKCESFN
jgi:NDP-sugar pyrophosphorylase family protein